MRVLLVGEGPHELGDGEGPSALENLVRALLARDDLQFERRRMADHRVHTHRGTGAGHFKRAVAWLREAQRSGHDALVLVIDEDGRRATRGDIDLAQATTLFTTPRALGVAIRTFDAWMLADHGALGQALGMPVPPQRDPERISNPKSVCRDLHAGSGNPDSLRVVYAATAVACDPNELESRCPHGFAPFAGRVRALSSAVESR